MTEEVTTKTVDPSVKMWKRLSVLEKKIAEMQAEKETITEALKAKLG